jgi:trimeric autotransporter adhesin
MKLINYFKMLLLILLISSGFVSQNALAQPITISCPAGPGTCLQVTQGAASQIGIAGLSGSGTAVTGTSTSSIGVSGFSGTSNGVQGQSSAAPGNGVYGTNTSTGTNVIGVSGFTSAGIGTGGGSTTGTGVLGGSDSGIGVSGQITSTTNSNAIGVTGFCQAGRGVYGNSTSGNGVAGNSTTGIGVYGTSTDGAGGTFINISGGNNNGAVGQTSYGGASGLYGVNTSGTGYGVAGRIIQTSNAAGYAIYGDNNATTSGAYAGYFNGRVFIVTGLQVGANCVSGNCSSDERLKKNIQSLNGSLDILTQLRPVTFEWKDTTGREDRPAGIQTGFIAQEIEKVKPEWVKTDAQGFKTVNRDELPMLLVDSIKELSANVKTLTAQNEELRSRMASIEMSKHPISSNLGLFGGLGFLAIGGAFFVGRKRSAK